MRLIDSTVLAQLGGKELRPFQLLEMTLDGGIYRYTDCDVPIGSQLLKTTITDGPANHGLSLVAGAAFARLNGLDLTQFINSVYLLTLTDGAGKTATGYIEEADTTSTLLDSELFTNPGFETRTGTDDDGVADTFTGWSTNSFLTTVVESVTAATIYPHSGTRCVKCSGGGRISKGLSVDDFGEYRFGFWTYGDGEHAGKWEVRYYSGDLIATGSTGPYGQGLFWTYVEVDLTLPRIAGAVSINLMQTESAGFVCFDDASFKKILQIGGAEALGTELLTNGGFETPGGGGADIFGSWSENTTAGGTLADEGFLVHGGSHALKATCGAINNLYSHVSQTIVTTVGKLYKFSFWTRGDGTNAGTIFIYDYTNGTNYDGYVFLSTGVSGTVYTKVSVYVTARSISTMFILVSPLTANGSAYFDDVYVQEVTHAGASGVHIVSAAGGSDRNWASIESGFNYNAATYTATLSGARFEPRGFHHDGARYSLGRVVDKITLEIDNIDQTLSTEFIGGTPQGAAVSLKEIVLNSNYMAIGDPITWFSGTIDDWEGEEGRLRITIVGPNFAWSRRTVGRHPSSCRWRVFGGTECAYAGAAPFCDRSFTRCAALGNTNEFGGFRWLPSIENKELVWGRKA